MKTILIPTYFDQTCFAEIKDLIMNSIDEKVHLVFFHAYKLSDSISDLLMLSRRTSEYGQIPDEFHKACQNLKESNDQVMSIKIEYFYGNTVAAFRNFVEANEITEVYYPKSYQFNPISKHSLDPAILLSKCAIPAFKASPRLIRKVEEEISIAV
jgi:hypothetical protein